MRQGYRSPIGRDGEGQVALTPEEPEDMWHLYNLIQEGDWIRASTIRKVTTESATGTTASNKVRTTLTLAIESIEYDTQACVLRLKGRNVVENDYVKIGQYHTLDLELNKKFTLHKKDWDSVALDRLEVACDTARKADVAAVVMQEGLAHICLVTPFMTLLRAKIETAVPRKRRGNCAQHEKALHKFYDQVVQGILRHVDLDQVKCLLVASPGFVKDHFYSYLFTDLKDQPDLKLLLENKGKFVLVHSSSGFKHALREVLADPLVQARLQDTKAASEVKALDQFYQLLNSEPSRAFYGLKHVEKANYEYQAIEILLISDRLFRSKDLKERKRFVRLVDSVKENNGVVKIFSSLHISGEQLDQLTGIAAILRFGLPDLEELDLDHDEDDDGVETGSVVGAVGSSTNGPNDNSNCRVAPETPIINGSL